MKLKYYLRGLGIGIILTVIILSIARAGKSDNLTNQEIIKRAEQLGMIMKEDQESSKSETLKDRKEKQEKLEDVEPEALEEENSTVEPDSSQEGTVQPETLEEENTESHPETTEESSHQEESGDTDQVTREVEGEDTDASLGGENFVDIEIPSGLDAYEISAKLEEAGVIENATSFRNFLWNKDIDIVVNSGSYQIPKGIQHEDLARMICQSWNN